MANMPRPPDLNWRQHLQCGNSRGTVDLVFMAQGPMPLVCDAFAQAEIRLAEALALYKQAALAIRDPSTRNRARRRSLRPRTPIRRRQVVVGRGSSM